MLSGLAIYGVSLQLSKVASSDSSRPDSSQPDSSQPDSSQPTV
jgi:hypothetical protein